MTLTRVMAVELASRGIRVNSIAPGPIETAMAGLAHSPEVRRQWSRAVPIGRYGSPKEVAEAVCWLIRDRSSYVDRTDHRGRRRFHGRRSTRRKLTHRLALGSELAVGDPR